MQKNQTLTIENDSDFIFKYGNYTNTYIIVTIEGTPDNVTLNLVDEDLNQLYSPYDINGGEVTSMCVADVNSTNVIQLPANFNNDLSEWTDFDAGVYNWNLYWTGNENYEPIIVPLSVEIRDFDIWEQIDKVIYPNENITVRVRTYVDTIPSSINALTTNAVYDSTTGIVTYPNQDLISTTVGEHTQVINQINNQSITYTITNPIQFSIEDDEILLYDQSASIGVEIKNDCTLEFTSTLSTITIDEITYPITNTSTQYQYIDIRYYTPGTHNYTIESTLNNTQTYTITGNFEISKTGCLLTLEELNNTLVSTYSYDNETEVIPIANAQLGLINNTTGTLVETQTTDAQGQITWQTNIPNNNYYKVVAIDINNQYILESNTTLTSYLFYDDASTDNTSAITISNPNNLGYTFVHNTDAYTLTKNGASDKFIYLDFLTVNTQIDVVYELDLNITERTPQAGGYNVIFVLGDDKYSNTTNGFNMGTWSSSKFLRYIDNGTMLQDKTDSNLLLSNTWYHFKAIIKSDYVYGEISRNNDIILSYENNNISPIVEPMYFSIGFMSGSSSTQKIKNIKIEQL